MPLCGKGDEDDGASGFAEQPDFREGRVLFSFLADAGVGIEKHDVSAIKRASLAYSPCAALATGYRFAMKQRAFWRPDRRPLKRRNATFRQRRKPGVQFFIEQPPRWLLDPFEVPSVRASIVSRRVIPGDAKFPVRASEGAQESEFQNVANIAGILVAHVVPRHSAKTCTRARKLADSALPVSSYRNARLARTGQELVMCGHLEVSGEMLLLVAEHDGQKMLARIAVMRALNRNGPQ